MKTLLRTLLSFALIVWIGAEIFFPIVAAITFNSSRAGYTRGGRHRGPVASHPAWHGAGGGNCRACGAGAGSGVGHLQAARRAGAHGAAGCDDRCHRLLAVRHHFRHGSRPESRWRRDRHERTSRIPRPFTSTHCINAAYLWRRRFCCWGWRRWCWWRGRKGKALSRIFVLYHRRGSNDC